MLPLTPTCASHPRPRTSASPLPPDSALAPGFHEGAWKLRLGDLTAEGLARQREQEQLKEGQLRRAIELLRTKVLAVEARRNSILQQHPALVETAISHDHAMMQSVPGSIHMNVLSIDIVNTNIYVVAGGPARP